LIIFLIIIFFSFSIILGMPKWTIKISIFAFNSISAWSSFININMIICFFPSMTIRAIHHIRTAYFKYFIPSFKIICYIIKFFPIRTIFWRILNFIIFKQSSSIVLWIMSIYTMLSIKYLKYLLCSKVNGHQTVLNLLI